MYMYLVFWVEGLEGILYLGAFNLQNPLKFTSSSLFRVNKNY